MSELIKLLELRRDLKAKKPAFNREDSHKKGKLSTSWRKPKGHHSKMRERKRGYNKMVEVGYRSPQKVRGLHQTGLKEILVHNAAQLEGLDHRTDGVMIANVGLKKKLDIIKEAEKKKLHILNVKDVKKFLENASKNLEQRKQRRSELKSKGKKKTGKKEAAKEEKQLTDEEKAEMEKREKEKVLIKKGSE